MRTTTVVTPGPASGSSGRSALACARSSLRSSSRRASAALATSAACCAASSSARFCSRAAAAAIARSASSCRRRSSASSTARRRCSSSLIAAGAKSTSSSVSTTHTASAGSNSTTNTSMCFPSAVKATESPFERVENTPAIAASRLPLGSSSVANSSESGSSLAKVPLGSSALATVRLVPSSMPIARMIHSGTMTHPSGAENSRTPVYLGRPTPDGKLSLKSIGRGIRPDGMRAIIACKADGGSRILSASERPSISITSDESACRSARHIPAKGAGSPGASRSIGPKPKPKPKPSISSPSGMPSACACAACAATEKGGGAPIAPARPPAPAGGGGSLSTAMASVDSESELERRESSRRCGPAVSEQSLSMTSSPDSGRKPQSGSGATSAANSTIICSCTSAPPLRRIHRSSVSWSRSCCRVRKMAERASHRTTSSCCSSPSSSPSWPIHSSDASSTCSASSDISSPSNVCILPVATLSARFAFTPMLRSAVRSTSRSRACASATTSCCRTPTDARGNAVALVSCAEFRASHVLMRSCAKMFRLVRSSSGKRAETDCAQRMLWPTRTSHVSARSACSRAKSHAAEPCSSHRCSSPSTGRFADSSGVRSCHILVSGVRRGECFSSVA
mmetsp:Transcript_23334/g.56197  ORF Transcript_23334/g.56197 Transcript_23334/m.56197 type:complete len:625 (-) Transcript_23334:898-2772(-)